MVLDIDEFRLEKGGNPDKVKENQKRRFCDVGMVDKIVAFDTKWREGTWLYNKNIIYRVRMNEFFFQLATKLTISTN